MKHTSIPCISNFWVIRIADSIWYMYFNTCTIQDSDVAPLWHPYHIWFSSILKQTNETGNCKASIGGNATIQRPRIDETVHSPPCGPTSCTVSARFSKSKVSRCTKFGTQASDAGNILPLNLYDIASTSPLNHTLGKLIFSWLIAFMQSLLIAWIKPMAVVMTVL